MHDLQTGAGHALVPIADAGLNIAVSGQENGAELVDKLSVVNWSVAAGTLAGIAVNVFFGLTDHAMRTSPETQRKVARVVITAACSAGAMIESGSNLPQAIAGGLIGLIHSKITTTIVPRWQGTAPAKSK